MNSLNPVFLVGNPARQTLLRLRGHDKAGRVGQSVDMLKAVGIPFPEKPDATNSFQMSGVSAST